MSRRAAPATRAACAASSPCALSAPPGANASATCKLSIDASERSGRLVAELSGVESRFDERPLVRAIWTCGSCAAIGWACSGPNGAGKSTLIKLILGLLAARYRHGAAGHQSAGCVLRSTARATGPGPNTRRHGQRGLGLRGGERRASAISAAISATSCFRRRRFATPVRALSGGERNRLLLARLFARPANLLVLDEPTNDLDIESLDLLEASLQSFQGTLLLVSHDRSFVDNVVTQTLVAEGEGHWQEYAGGYRDWLAQRTAAPAPAAGGDAEIARTRCRADAARVHGRKPRSRRAPKAVLQGNPRIGRIARRRSRRSSPSSANSRRGCASADYFRVRRRAHAERIVRARPRSRPQLSACLERWEHLERTAGGLDARILSAAIGGGAATAVELPPCFRMRGSPCVMPDRLTRSLGYSAIALLAVRCQPCRPRPREATAAAAVADTRLGPHRPVPDASRTGRTPTRAPRPEPTSSAPIRARSGNSADALLKALVAVSDLNREASRLVRLHLVGLGSGRA